MGAGVAVEPPDAPRARLSVRAAPSRPTMRSDRGTMSSPFCRSMRERCADMVRAVGLAARERRGPVRVVRPPWQRNRAPFAHGAARRVGAAGAWARRAHGPLASSARIAMQSRPRPVSRGPRARPVGICDLPHEWPASRASRLPGSGYISEDRSTLQDSRRDLRVAPRPKMGVQSGRFDVPASTVDPAMFDMPTHRAAQRSPWRLGRECPAGGRESRRGGRRGVELRRT